MISSPVFLPIYHATPNVNMETVGKKLLGVLCHAKGCFLNYPIAEALYRSS